MVPKEAMGRMTRMPTMYMVPTTQVDTLSTVTHTQLEIRWALFHRWK